MTTLTNAAAASLAAALLLASQAAAQTTLYAQPGSKAGAQAGHSVTAAYDVDQDGVRDFLVGEPGYALIASFVPGRAVLYSGRTGEPIFTLNGLNHDERFGHAVSAGLDYDGDGWRDFFVSAPGYDSSRGRVALFSGRTGAQMQQWQGLHQGSYFGTAVELVGRYDNGPLADFAISAPNENVSGVTSLGRVRVYSGETLALLAQISPPSDYANSSYGLSLTGNFDWNGDGRADLAIGAPLAKWPGASGFFYGMVDVVLSSGGVVQRTFGAVGSWHGAAVVGLGDVDGDGTAEFAAGAPFDDVAGNDAGRVRVYSSSTPGTAVYELAGATGSKFGSSLAALDGLAGTGQIGLLVGAPEHPTFLLGVLGRVSLHAALDGALVEQAFGVQMNGRFGASVAALGDLNGDHAGDWMAGAPSADLPEANIGYASVTLSSVQGPVGYCSAKTNSLGCLPYIGYSGAASVSVGDNFVVRATNVRSSSPGIYIYGFVPASIPFHGGTLCVGAPVVRGLVQGSGGTPGGADCSGVYEHHWTIAAMQSAGFVPGTTVYGQFWSRDTGFPAPDNIGLTAGLRFEVLP